MNRGVQELSYDLKDFDHVPTSQLNRTGVILRARALGTPGAKRTRGVLSAESCDLCRGLAQWLCAIFCRARARCGSRTVFAVCRTDAPAIWRSASFSCSSARGRDG